VVILHQKVGFHTFEMHR